MLLYLGYLNEYVIDPLSHFLCADNLRVPVFKLLPFIIDPFAEKTLTQDFCFHS